MFSDSTKLNEAYKKTIEYFEKKEKVDMSRLKGQMKVAIECMKAFKDGKKNIVIQAPTGFGKSLLALFVTKMFEYLDDDNESYILTPNKFLQKQYIRDSKFFGLDYIKSLEGQNNYICTENDKPFPKRACLKFSLGKIKDQAKFSECSGACKYLNEREACYMSRTSILNYHFFLTTMNKSYETLEEKAVFQPRKLTIFDEAHVLGDTVQSMFSLEFDANMLVEVNTRFKYLLDLTRPTFEREGDIGVFTNQYVDSIKNITRELKVITDNIDDNEMCLKATETIDKNLEDIHKKMDFMFSIVTKGRVPDTETGEVDLSEDEQIIADCMSELYRKKCDITDYITDIKNYGETTAVFSVIESEDKDLLKAEFLNNMNTKTIRFQCVKENEMCASKCLKYTDLSIFMSATFGDSVKNYAEQTGIENYHIIDIPQIFNYDKSPIRFMDYDLSMAYKNIRQNTPEMVELVHKIMAYHKNERGIIHTGNFRLANELASKYSDRIITYRTAVEKEQAIEVLKTKPNGVVIGPSLVEGVDLKDDLCRFMIFMKVPYDSLADRLTARKQRYYRNWYNWKTMCSFTQGLGRGIRNDKDYCMTYLLDSEFMNFFNRTTVPKYIEDRIRIVRKKN